MQNLFLATSKYIFKHWVAEGILNKKDLETLEEKIEKLEVPVDIGRLPKAISSNHGSYTAEQLKNWTVVYSLYALKNILPEQHLQCWQSFVLACKYLCKPVLWNDDITRAHLLLLKFCRTCQKLYGTNFCTPNMHLHCHLKDIIRDFGPIHSFWCFSFERYNGIMGSFTTNNRSIELQLMRKLTTLRSLDNITLGSKMAYRSKRSTGILAAWPGLDGEIDQLNNAMSFGVIDFYFCHSLNIGGEFVKFYFTCVTWHRAVEDTCFNINPLRVASVNEKLAVGSSWLLPVQRISTKCAIAVEENEHKQKRYVISPLIRHFVS